MNFFGCPINFLSKKLNGIVSTHPINCRSFSTSAVDKYRGRHRSLARASVLQSLYVYSLMAMSSALETENHKMLANSCPSIQCHHHPSPPTWTWPAAHSWRTAWDSASPRRSARTPAGTPLRPCWSISSASTRAAAVARDQPRSRWMSRSGSGSGWWSVGWVRQGRRRPIWSWSRPVGWCRCPRGKSWAGASPQSSWRGPWSLGWSYGVNLDPHGTRRSAGWGLLFLDKRILPGG